MLIIRTEQMQAFQAARRRTARDGVRHRFLADGRSGSAPGVSEAGRKPALATALDRAEALGLSTEAELWLYVETCLDFGWNFEGASQNAWVRQALTDPRIASAVDRLRRVRCRLERIQIVERVNAEARFEFAHGQR